MIDFTAALNLSPKRPSAGKWNRFVRLMQRARVKFIGNTGRPLDDLYPWQVTALRWPDEEQANPVADRAWKFTVEPGWVLDYPATIAYLRQGDPRLWTPPDGWPVPQPADPDYNAMTIERPLIDAFDTAPYLWLLTPESGEINPTGTSGFRAVADAVRPAYFQTEAMWEMSLYRASVFLSSELGTQLRYAVNAPGSSIHHRVAAGPLPSRSTFSGPLVELARLYLTRDATGDPANDQIYVQQLVFWNLWMLDFSFSGALAGLGEGESGAANDILTGTAESSAASLEYWTA